MAEAEHCCNCSRPIGKLEHAFLWNDKVVCFECYGRLSRCAQSPDTGASSSGPGESSMGAALPRGTTRPASGNPFAMVGILLLIAGLCVAAYFFFVYDTTVTTEFVYVPGVSYRGEGPHLVGGDRVHNIGLQQNRQLGCIAGIIAAAVGIVLLALHTKRGSSPVASEQVSVAQQSSQPDFSSPMAARPPIENPCRPGSFKYALCQGALKGVTIEKTQMALEALAPGAGCRLLEYISDLRSENGLDIRIEGGRLICVGYL